MLDSSVYSKWITSQTDLSFALSIRSTKIYRAFEIRVNGSKISLESFQKIQKQLSYKIHFENTLLKFYIISIVFIRFNIEEIQLRYFELFWPRGKSPLD